MGLIREPQNVDFTSQSKPWTEEGLSDFRKLMTKLKAKKFPVSKKQKKETSKKEILEGLKEAIQQVNQIKAGKLKGKSIEDFLAEL